MRPKLQYMSTGAAVTELQTKLNVLMATVLPPLKVDGKFGDQTHARVKQFQRSRGLVVDGVVGAKTWAAIDGHAAPGATPPAPGPPAPKNPPGWDQLFPLVHHGARITCSYGTEARALRVVPPTRPANVSDDKAVINIPPFGGCCSLNNPAVAAAHNAFLEAKGSPQKPWDPGQKKYTKFSPIAAACSPRIPNGWKGAKRVEKVGTPPKRVLDIMCSAHCDYGGSIRFV